MRKMSPLEEKFGTNLSMPSHLPDWLRELLEETDEMSEEDRRKEDGGAFLQKVRCLFPRDKRKSLRRYGVLEGVQQLGEEVEEYLVNNDEECRLMSVLVENVERVLRTRSSTVLGPVSRSLPRQSAGSKYYSEFRKYLEAQNFIENMIDVIHRMFLHKSSLSEDPIKFVRENFGSWKEDEEALTRRWLELKRETDCLAWENETLRREVERLGTQVGVTVQQKPSLSAVDQPARSQRIPWQIGESPRREWRPDEDYSGQDRTAPLRQGSLWEELERVTWSRKGAYDAPPPPPSVVPSVADIPSSFRKSKGTRRTLSPTRDQSVRTRRGDGPAEPQQERREAEALFADQSLFNPVQEQSRYLAVRRPRSSSSSSDYSI